MKLRKCPSCKERVGAESEFCPRCGVSFRGTIVRRVVLWTIAVALLVWVIVHYLKR